VQQVKPDQTGIEVSVVHRSENAYSLWRILPVIAIEFRYIQRINAPRQCDTSTSPVSAF